MNEWDRWFVALSLRHKRKVNDWIRANPPPKEWQSTPLAYAFTEMPLTDLGLPFLDSEF